MNEISQAETAGVYLVAASHQLRDAVLEIGTLVGVNPILTGTEVPGDATLVLTEPEQVPSLRTSAPVVTVSDRGAGAELHLPGQAPELAQVLLSGSLRRLPEELSKRTVFVAGWQGGVGVSTIAARLAQVSDGLLLDASGNPPQQEVVDSDLHWGRIDPQDPPMLGELFGTLTRGSRKQGVLPKLPDVARVDDPRVLNLLGAARGDCVLDAGVWQPALEGALLGAVGAGRQVRLVLVGRADTNDCLRLVNVLTAATPLWYPRMLLSADKPEEQLRLISEHWDLELRRRPRSRSGKVWRRLWERIWQVDA